jgi:hypothetical protein
MSQAVKFAALVQVWLGFSGLVAVTVTANVNIPLKFALAR